MKESSDSEYDDYRAGGPKEPNEDWDAAEEELEAEYEPELRLYAEIKK